MSGSEGASPSRNLPSREGPPPLPPDDTSERIVDVGRSADARQRAVDSLLPPGADEEPAAPPVMGLGPLLAEFIAPQLGPRESARLMSAPAIDAVGTRPAAGGISAEEKAQRRFWKHVIVFGVCVVVLMVVCFLLAR